MGADTQQHITAEGSPRSAISDSCDEEKNDEPVFPVLSEDELVDFLSPHVVERCDEYLLEIHDLFDHGGCSRGEILRAGLADKVINTLPGVLVDQLTNAAETRLLEHVRGHIEHTISLWSQS